VVRDLLQSLDSPELRNAILDIYHPMRAAGMSLQDLRESHAQTGGGPASMLWL